jgi:hypothetical protein
MEMRGLNCKEMRGLNCVDMQKDLSGIIAEDSFGLLEYIFFSLYTALAQCAVESEKHAVMHPLFQQQLGHLVRRKVK